MHLEFGWTKFILAKTVLLVDERIKLMQSTRAIRWSI